jgi:transposase
LEDIIAGLPVTEVIIDPEEVKSDPDSWYCIGAEETKLVDYTPGRFSCQRIVRRKYVCKAQRHLPPITAPLSTLQERCMAAPGLLAHSMSLRYELHLPFYRIAQMYARQGVDITRQTLSNWAGMTAEASQLVVEGLHAEVFGDNYVQIDETPVKYQDPGRKGVCGTGWLWAIYNPIRDVCLFRWRWGRGAKDLQEIVPREYRGKIQCDGHGAYPAFAQSPERRGLIELAGCLAHARRKFFDAKAEGADPCWVLGQMRELYQIEARLNEAKATPQQVQKLRTQQSAPIMNRIHQRLEQWRDNRSHLPRSLTGEAITYTLNQWDKLEKYLKDGRQRIDNNLVENKIRPSAIGKKNWLFMGDRTTGNRAAVFYTLIGNCHCAEVDALAYLTDLFKRLPNETNKTVRRLTPMAWAADQKAAREQSLTQAAAATVLA